METTNTQTTTTFHFDESQVCNWKLPDGAFARLGRGSVRDMAFSPDGHHFAVGTKIGLWIYELSTLSPIALWETDRGFIDSVTFSPDAQWLAAYTYRQALRVWNIQNKSCIAEMEFKKKQDSIGLLNTVFSKDGEHLLAFSGFTMKIYVWCPRTGTQVRETEIELNRTETESINKIYPACFSTDLSLLAGLCYDHRNRTAEYIAVWNVETGEQIIRLDWTDRRGRHCFSPCGRFLAATGSEGRLHVWDVETGNLEETYTDHENAQIHPHYTPEGELIAAVIFPSHPKLEVWNLEKGEKIDTCEYQGKGNTVRFSESGTQFAYTDFAKIKIWTKGRHTDQALPTIQGHTGTVGSLVFAPDEKTLVTAYWGRNTVLWDVSSQCARHPSKKELPNKIRNVYLTSIGEILAVGGDPNTLEVCKFGNGESIAEISIPEPGLSSVTGTDALSLTGQRLTRAGVDRNIYVWVYIPSSNEMDEGGIWEKCAVLVGHADHLRALALSPDGKQLVSIPVVRRPEERTPLLWDVDAQEQITKLPLNTPERGGYNSSDVGITFSHDGNFIAGGFWNEIVLWDATDGKMLMTIPQSEENQRPITLRFSPCDQYLVAGAWWKGGINKTSICLWEVATGKNIATFKGHTTDVQCFAFNQDCTILASGGHDGVIFLWDLKPYINS
ncbi:WD40 repeat domain-containing protein [Candidatus Poribacteria bacterium]|nr:WD40 repeat domain-containing protein [Candidatus Poribacteria bacterium]